MNTVTTYNTQVKYIETVEVNGDAGYNFYEGGHFVWSLTAIAETIADRGLELVKTTGQMPPDKQDGWLQFAIHRKVLRDQDGNLEDVPAYAYGTVFAYVLGEHTPEDPLIEVALVPESLLNEEAISVVRWLRKAIVPKRP
jgi:hypothetical protein